MRKRLQFLLLIGFLMLILPMTALIHSRTERDNVNNNNENSHVSASFYKILFKKDEAVRDVPVRDYLIGAVAAEMPASYEPEALRAQVVAAHSYAEYIRQQNAAHPNASLYGADFSDDPAEYQAYASSDELRLLWGNDFDSRYEKIADAVDAVGDLILCYSGEPIAAAYHAVSAGLTASSADIWGVSLPYLVSVSSESDRNSPQFEMIISLAEDSVKRIISKRNPEISLSEDPACWLKSREDYHLQVGDAVWSSEKYREAFSLPASHCVVQYDADSHMFQFTVHGLGHNVGMSQYGANEMARSGSSYREILNHYYPNTKLTHV